MNTQSVRPPRPLGVTLAVMGGAMIFSFIPLVEIAIILLLQRTLTFDAGTGVSGIRISGALDQALIIQGLLASGYLIASWFAFRGVPRAMRFAYPGLTIVYALIYLGIRILPALNPSSDISQGLDSAANYANPYYATNLVLIVLITLYVAWYLNRWAARAFYRGYYRDEEKHRADPLANDLAT